MIYKYTYISRKNGIKIRTNKKLDNKKYKLVSEFRDTQLKTNELITK